MGPCLTCSQQHKHLLMIHSRSIYGLEAHALEDFELTDISHEPRAGILTRAAFLSVHAKI